MADTATRAPRSDAFIEVAQRLIRTKGYERMSIQDVLDAMGASRGAFYHYFDSKQALLEAVVERMTDAGLASVAPVVDDPALPALAKLSRIFSGIAGWKIERVELLRAIVDVWLSDENAVVREAVRAGLVPRMVPILTRIVEQGKAEGTFTTGDPSAVARVLVSLIQGANEAATELFVARQAREVSFEHVEATLDAYFATFERVLGLPATSLSIPDRAALLRQWYG